MTVFVNNREVEIFTNARIGDAILSYSKSSWKKVLSGKFGVFDRFGFSTSTDGPIGEGQKIFIKRIKQ